MNAKRKEKRNSKTIRELLKGKNRIPSRKQNTPSGSDPGLPHVLTLGCMLESPWDFAKP